MRLRDVAHWSVMLALHVVFSVSLARAQQCVTWEPAVLRSGGNGNIWAMTEWDPDGSGPMQRQLVVGGDFSSMGGIVSPRLAYFDGQQFRAWDRPALPITQSWNQPNCLFTREGELLAINGNRVLVLDNNGWRQVGPTLVGSGPWRGVYASGTLYVVACGAGQPGVYRLREGAWELIGVLQPGWYVYDAMEYNGSLLINGEFPTINGEFAGGLAEFTGEVWRTFGRSRLRHAGVVEAAVVHQGQLVVMGELNWDSIPSLTTSYNSVARWTGSGWNVIEAPLGSRFYRLGVAGDELIAVARAPIGSPQIGSEIVVFRLQGSQWVRIERWPRAGGPLLPDRSPPRPISFQGRLAIVTNESDPTSSFSTFSMINQDGVNEHVGQDFGAKQLVGWNAGAVVLSTSGNMIASTSGLQGPWRELPVPRTRGVPYSAVSAISNFGGELIAAGTPQQVTGDALSNPVVALRNGGWTVVGPDRQLSGKATQVFEFRGRLYAAGSMRLAGYAPEVQLAEFDGQQWKVAFDWASVPGQPALIVYGTGQTGGTIDGTSLFWQPVGGELFVTGALQSVGGVGATSCARYDGASWRATDAGLRSAPKSFARVRGDLYAGTEFQALRFDGSSWLPLSLQYPLSGTSYAGFKMVGARGQDLIVGGSNQSSTYVQVPSGWQNLSPTGDYDSGFGVAQFTSAFGEELLVGQSSSASSSTTASAHVHRLVSGSRPIVLMPMSNSFMRVFSTRQLSFYVVGGGAQSIVDFSVERDGLSLVPGVQSTGARLRVSRTSFDLTVASPADSGTYRMVFRTICGDAVSSDPIRVQVFCLADANRSGVVDAQDIFDYLNAWFAGVWSTDGPVINPPTTGELFRFLAAWFAGC